MSKDKSRKEMIEAAIEAAKKNGKKNYDPKKKPDKKSVAMTMRAAKLHMNA